jgi:sugar lactone lactonase YvrE
MADAVQLRVLAGKQPSWFTMWGFDKGTKPAVHTYYWAEENKQEGGKTVLRYTGKAQDAALGDGVESAYALLPDGKGFIHELKLPWTVVYAQDWTGAAGQTLRMGMEFLWGDSTGRTWPMHRYADNMQPGITSRERFWDGKNIWGDLTTVAASVKAPRKYVEGSLKPQGTIPVRVQVPAAAKTFTVAINDRDGRRVRNLAGGYAVSDFSVARDGDQATVEVMWDGLDEVGKLVAPGAYTVRGLTQGGIDGYYEMSFYNPGTPPWQTSDGLGGWGADHTAPRLLARSGDNMVIACDFAEGGYGTFAVKPDGTKAWSEKRGANVLAATPEYVFTVPNDWGVSGVQLLRLNAKDGAFAPFVHDGKELPMPLSFHDLLGIPAAAAGAQAAPLPKSRALAVAYGVLVLATDDNRLWLFDADTAQLIKQTTLELTGFDDKYPFACDGKAVYFFRQKELVKVGIEALKTEANPSVKAVVVPLKNAVELPGAVAFDDAGNLYVTDLGKDLQVKKFAPDGKQLGTFGKPGGRARQGAFEPEGMRYMAGLAVDAAGNAWVAEYSHLPRRVSVWKPNGKLLRDFIGNGPYGGGCFIHDTDPTKGVAELNEISLDPATHTWTVASVMVNPDPAKGDVVLPGNTHYGTGNTFFSAASGEKHEYFTSLGYGHNTPVFVMIKQGQDWQPVAGVFTVARLQNLSDGKNPTGEYADNYATDMLIWNDFNNDGYVQKAECEIMPCLKTPAPKKDQPPVSAGVALPIGGFDGGSRVDPTDFSFYSDGALKTAENRGVFRWKPVRFRDGGRPVYGTAGISPLTKEFGLMQAVPVPGKDLVVGFINKPDMTCVSAGSLKPYSPSVYVAGFTKSEGKVLWKYLSPYNSVHGSHIAPMPRPGLLIGCLKIAGIVAGCGDGADVFMIRGNLGEDYYLTTDGLFVDILTKDARIPGILVPEDETEMRSLSFAALSGGMEHFSGVISRQADGVVRCSGGFPAGSAGNIIRIEGLESIRRFTAADLNVTQEALVKADGDNTRRALAAAKPQEPFPIALAQKDAKGGVDWTKAKALRIAKEGQPVTAEFRAAYDTDNLYIAYNVNDRTPWKNSGNDYHLLFKTGDAVDFQLSPSGNQSARAGAGDLRIMMANFQGKPVAVLLKPVAPGAPAADKFTFSSPVMTVAFDQVKLLADVVPEVAVRGDGYTVTAKVPWALLGVQPTPELKLRGDAGFILSDPSGVFNTARVYWSNKHANLVSDQPSEALITPQGFGEFILGK